MPKSYDAVQNNLKVAAVTLDRIKTESGCFDCGFNKWPEALHFDHLDPLTKRAELGWMRDRSKLQSKRRLDRYLRHVAKYCVIRCANCHARRTKDEKHYLVRRSPEVSPEFGGISTLF